jgi:hypothetical protein
MTVETATTINTLDATYPASTDPKAEGDDHIRLIKSSIKTTFPNIAGIVSPTHIEVNYLDGVTSAIQTQFDNLTGTFASYAPLASPSLTGTPTSTTPALTDGSTRIATMGSVSAAIGSVNSQSALINSIETGTTFNIAIGTHHIITNAATTTATAPATPTAGQLFKVSVANGISTNVINWNGGKHESKSDATMTIDDNYASMSWQWINSTIGWKKVA